MNGRMKVTRTNDNRIVLDMDEDMARAIYTLFRGRTNYDRWASLYNDFTTDEDAPSKRNIAMAFVDHLAPALGRVVRGEREETAEEYETD